MEARLVAALPTDEGWQFEPKWDGFRCLAHKDGSVVELRAKSGKSLNRFFPDVAALIANVKEARCMLDGEIVVVVDGVFAFEALQARLHPAESRVRKLAAEQPAQFLAFDCLARGGASLLEAPLTARRHALESVLKRAPPGIALTPFTRDAKVARRWLGRAGKAMDGVIAKRLDGVYAPGERAMLKVKRLRTADCVVAGFRYATGAKIVGSLLLGLYDDDGLLHHVGFTSSLSVDERTVLIRELKPLITSVSFTGEAPGKSRWNAARAADWHALKPRLVVEVQYDQVTDGRFRHGTRLIRWRPDKSPAQCTFDQLAPPLPPAEVAQLLARS